MNAIISNGDYTASVQLPIDRRQLAGALSYLGANRASGYDIKYIKYNEESDQGLSFTLDCRGIVENAIAKAIPTGFRFHTFNDTIALLHNLPYVNRREFENIVKVEGLASYEQLNRMLTEAYPQSVTTKYYSPLTIQVHGTNSWGEVDEDGYEEDAAFAARHEDVIRQRLAEYNSIDENNMAEYFDGNNGVSEKLRSVEWGFERRNGELYGCITVQTAGPLTVDEEQDLKEWIAICPNILLTSVKRQTASSFRLFPYHPVFSAGYKSFHNIQRRIRRIFHFFGYDDVRLIADNVVFYPFVWQGIVFRFVFRNFNLLIIDFNYAKRQEISYGY